MAQAYTPGLAVSRGTTIRKDRKLPLRGEVLVALGDQVEDSSSLGHHLEADSVARDDGD